MSLVKLWIVAGLAALLICAPSSFAATQARGPKKDAAKKEAPAPPAGTTTSASTTTAGEPSTGEAWVAVLAILAGVAIAGAVVGFVWHAHDIQAKLAAATIARGGTVSTDDGGATPAKGLAEDSEIEIVGPDELALGSAGEYTVATEVTGAVWSVIGLGAFTQVLKNEGRTFVFTPNEQKDGVSVHVVAGGKQGNRPVKIVAPAKTPFVIRVAVRNWGLVVVAVFIVAGAIALGVTGHLDGGNFVALVAPLAALLGVAAATSGGGGGGGGSAGGGGASGGSSGG